MTGIELTRGAARLASGHSSQAAVKIHSRTWSLFAKSKPASSLVTSKDSGTVETKVDGAVQSQASTRSIEDPQKQQVKKKKTIAQLDEEMRLAMEGRAGDGGESGLELEDGKPVSMKRGVRENMFRYI